MKKAFTLLELVFVVVVIGVLAVTILPKTDSNTLYEAANHIISDIRYTQHLAIVNDVYDKNRAQWYKGKWQLLYSKSNSSSRDTGGYYAVTIFSDLGADQGGKPEISEIAVNPLNPDKVMSGGYSGEIDWEDNQATIEMNIGYKYGISSITQSGCSGKRIAFDNKGRPYVGDDSSWTSSVDGVLTKQCKLTLTKDSKSVTIIIEPETGYVHFS